jgi:hypothetical protein
LWTWWRSPLCKRKTGFRMQDLGFRNFPKP